jgi:glycosyltransferase involved in cell wall biosynthesis
MRYVLITPVRDEVRFIDLTIQSMVAQTVRPLKWVIVSDGSTDGTDDIVRRYASENPWIELIRMPERRERHFAGKVYAFQAGYASVQGMQYDAIGSLDGDVSFDRDFFVFLLRKLSEDESLGLVGASYIESSREAYDYVFSSVDDVPGVCQLFRRECFEEVGGYTPLKGGGIDYVALIAARMKGWRTRAFPENVCIHHGTAQRSGFSARFKLGMKDYALGNGPLWELLRTLYQMTRRPFVFRGVLLGAGYFWAFATRRERPISRDMITFIRQDHTRRLRKALVKFVPKPLQQFDRSKFSA